MATVKLARTTSCNRAIAYAEKRAVEKDGLNCEITNAKQEMTTVRELYAKNDKTQAHLCIQSFSPEESQKLGAKKINQLGIELAEKMAPNHQVAVYTHADKDHIHNHIVINSVNLETGEKYHHNNDFERVAKIHDELLREHKLEVVKKQAVERRTMAERQLSQKGTVPWKDTIRQEIDSLMRDASVSSYKAFRECLKEKGIKVHDRGKNVTYELLEGNKRVRGAKLGADYEKDVIKNELDRREKARKLEPNEERYDKFKERLADGQPEDRTDRPDRRAISDRARLAELRHERELTDESRLAERNLSDVKPTIPKTIDFGPKL
ncbi:relaxase/mobilization nuclease domain-containing protein [uncultured Rummeliibacillus sp.]|uniref:relaxase/mobilization nuclease domain-containing protein n=1 Tax=uncultured Rummeliibacillus sp. TaxID=762292 RepID=UPI00261D54E4|nr:relaxase/mobilization nuclease domain-containing protein [uncultured Rummeliibacillus sp.]